MFDYLRFYEIKLQPDDVDFDIEGPKRPLWKKLEETIDAIQNTPLFSSQHGEEINYLVMKMQNLLSCAKVESLEQ